MEFASFLTLARRFLQDYSIEQLRLARKVLSPFYGDEGHRWVERLRECERCKDTILIFAPYNSDRRKLDDRDGGCACINCYLCTDCCECSTCSECGVWRDPEAICSDCDNCENHCTCSRCQRCGERVDRDDEDTSLCDDCERCDRCCRCDREPAGIRFCDRSIDDPDGENETPTFHEPKKKDLVRNPSARMLSPEIEISYLQGAGRGGAGKRITNVVYKWGGRIVKDGSLGSGGFEINPAPAGGDLFLTEMNQVFDALDLADAVADETCGMHVHIDARDFTSFDIRRLVRFYSIIEDVLFAMVPEERRSSTYCEPCAKKYMRWLNKPVKSSQEIRHHLIKATYGTAFSGSIDFAPVMKKDRKSGVRLHKLNSNGTPKMSKFPVARGDRSFADTVRTKDSGNRYTALNLVSWFYRGTVECRLYPGTTSYEDATRWSMMWAAILDFCIKSSDADISKLDKTKQRSTLFKALEGRADLIAFVDESIKRYNAGVYVEYFDGVRPAPPAPPPPPPAPDFSIMTPEQVIVWKLRNDPESFTDPAEYDLRPRCTCDSCFDGAAHRILEMRRNRTLERQVTDEVEQYGNIQRVVQRVDISFVDLDNDSLFEEDYVP